MTRLEVPKRGEERADACTEEIHQKFHVCPKDFHGDDVGNLEVPPLMSHGSKSGDNAQTNVGTVGIFKGMLKMKISVRISLIQFWGAKAGIWHLGYVPFSSISDGHFHHYYLLIMLFSCTNPHIVACLIFCSHI